MKKKKQNGEEQDIQDSSTQKPETEKDHESEEKKKDVEYRSYILSRRLGFKKNR